MHHPSKESLENLVAVQFFCIYQGQWSREEFLLRPRDAILFCEKIRYDNLWFDLTETEILTALMNAEYDAVEMQAQQRIMVETAKSWQGVFGEK